MDLQPIDSSIHLCSICIAIRPGSFDNSQADKTHHADRESLLKSVSEGCYFCVSLWKLASSALVSDHSRAVDTKYEVYPSGDDAFAIRLFSSDDGIGLRWSATAHAQDSIKVVEHHEKADEKFESLHDVSSDDLEQIKAWLDRCQKGGDKHFGCTTRTLPYVHVVPMLLDIGSSDSRTFKLVMVKDTDWESIPEYATLSHVLEGAPRLTLTATTRGRLLAGCQDADVDDDVRHAIQICRHVGLRYIWVPSLCIYHDTVAPGEEMSLREHEVGGLDCDTYLFSALNLVSSRVANASKETLDSQAYVRKAVDVPWSGQKKSYVLFDRKWWDVNITNLPTLKHPKALAQYILAGRILYFDHWSGQMFWECRARRGQSSTIFPDTIPGSIGGTNGQLLRAMLGQCLYQEPLSTETYEEYNHRPLHALWNEVSTAFSQLSTSVHPLPDMGSLSVSESKHSAPNEHLLGIAPIARFLRIYMPINYSAGLWQPHAPNSLTWYVANDYMPVATLPSSRIQSTPPMPTWSWASVGASHSLASTGYEWGNMSLMKTEAMKT